MKNAFGGIVGIVDNHVHGLFNFENYDWQQRLIFLKKLGFNTAYKAQNTQAAVIPDAAASVMHEEKGEKKK